MQSETEQKYNKNPRSALLFKPTRPWRLLQTFFSLSHTGFPIPALYQHLAHTHTHHIKLNSANKSRKSSSKTKNTFSATLMVKLNERLHRLVRLLHSRLKLRLNRPTPLIAITFRLSGRPSRIDLSVVWECFECVRPRLCKTVQVADSCNSPSYTHTHTHLHTSVLILNK